jgi:hypothetical protein
MADLICMYCGRSVKRYNTGLTGGPAGPFCKSSPDGKHILIADTVHCVLCGDEKNTNVQGLSFKHTGAFCPVSPTKEHLLIYFPPQINKQDMSNKEKQTSLAENKNKTITEEQKSKEDNSTTWECFHCGNYGYGYSDKTLFHHKRFHPECFEEFKKSELGQKWIEERKAEEAEDEKIRNIDTRRKKISGIIFPIISCILLFFITFKNNSNGGFIIWGILLIIHFIVSRFLISFLHPFSVRSTILGIVIKLLFTIIIWSIFIGISYYFSNLLLNVFTSTPKIDMGSSINGVK